MPRVRELFEKEDWIERMEGDGCGMLSCDLSRVGLGINVGYRLDREMSLGRSKYPQLSVSDWNIKLHFL